MTYGVRLDRFSSLDHLTRKQLENDELVLSVLSECKRVSTFEMSENTGVRSAVTRLQRSGKIKFTELPYPWCGIEITALSAGESR